MKYPLLKRESNMSRNHNHPHHEHHNGHDHDKHGHAPHSFGSTKSLALVISFNIIITIAQYAGGILSGSLALISDAGHNLSDVFSLILGYIGIKVSEKKPDAKYTFGLKRFEVLIALVNSISLFMIGIYIVYEAVKRFANPAPIDISIMLPVAAIGLAGNLLSILVLGAHRDSSLNMKAAFLHLFFDALSSVAVIGAAVIIHFTGALWADLAVSIIIVFMIAWSSIRVITESLRIFLQGAPSGLDTSEILAELEGIGGVREVHGLHVWSINSKEIFLSCHICLDESSAGKNSDSMIKSVNSLLEKKFAIAHTAVQIETDQLCALDGGDSCCR